jgi:hypothetical protein
MLQEYTVLQQNINLLLMERFRLIGQLSGDREVAFRRPHGVA